MKNSFSLKRNATFSPAEKTVRLVGVKLAAASTILFAVTGLVPLVSQAQRLYVPVRVSQVSSQSSTNGTLVTIAADSPLTRAQTWHDDEGYHVVLPDTVPVDSLKPARGVKVRRLGSSLEVLVQTRPGARVNVHSTHNQLNLAIDGKLVARPTDTVFPAETTSAEERRLFEGPQLSPQQTEPLQFSSSVPTLTANSGPAGTENSQTASGANANPASVQATPEIGSNQIVPQGDGTIPPEAPPSKIKIHAEDDGLLASVFSGTSVLIVLALGLFGLLVSRKLRSRQELAPTRDTSPFGENASEDLATFDTNAQAHNPDNIKSLVRGGEFMPTNGSSRQSVVRLPVAGPASLYGAYRIDQEIGKLILGQPHRIDVLASRAIDDRRAIETSLIKGVNSPELDESARTRAREALEEYGFVARQCAALLLAPDAFERTTAARSLGEIKSAAALPFLLEGLYDSESIVRNQAVVSIGELKLPSAIGALLDIARTHPDVPSALLSRTLSACSVEGLDFFDAVVPDPPMLGTGSIGSIIEEITHLEPAVAVENLPESFDDERLAKALSALESIDVGERSEALKTLVQFRVQSAVDAISQVARHDSDPAIRSLAISSLGTINHESVFPAVLIGMADDSREVRASAARSLNRLSFDRADAYVRVIETGDEETLRNVAKACIQAGIVSQNLDRLIDSDHRQAYETFSLICLLAKAKMNEPVLEAISDHPRIDVRLKAVHLLACTGQTDTFDQLRELALKDGIGEEVKTAVLEAMYKLDQAKPKEEATLDQALIVNNEFQDTFEGAFVVSHAQDTPEGSFLVEGESQSETLEPEAMDTNLEPELEATSQPNPDEYEL